MDSSALDGVKVLDLTEERGLFAGRMLADMGAEVVLVEDPAGSKSRQVPPFQDDIPGTENSLYFLNFNTNKKSITLNLNSPAGSDIFKELVKRADVVIEDGPVGRMKALGLDYPELEKLNKGIIMASITGFGQSGPYSKYKAPDIVSFAMGGLMFVNGPEDAAPVVAPCEQSHYSVSVEAVFGIITALFMKLSTGEGQHIDTSTHEVSATFTGGIMMYSSNAQIAKRSGSQFGAVPGRIYPCKDGYVHILIIRPNHWQAFLEVMGNPEALMGQEYNNGTVRNKNVDLIDAHVYAFTMNHTKMEIAESCQEKGVPCVPLNTPPEFCQDPHIKTRNFVVQAEHPVIGEHSFLSPVCRLSETPCRIKRSAPLLGQHNQEVYEGVLGFAPEKLAALKAEGTI